MGGKNLPFLLVTIFATNFALMKSPLSRISSIYAEVFHYSRMHLGVLTNKIRDKNINKTKSAFSIRLTLKSLHTRTQTDRPNR